MNLKWACQGKFFVNALAEPAEVAAAEIVPQVREVAMAASASGSAQIKVLTPPVALKKIFRRLIFGEGKGRYYPE